MHVNTCLGGAAGGIVDGGHSAPNRNSAGKRVLVELEAIVGRGVVRGSLANREPSAVAPCRRCPMSSAPEPRFPVAALSNLLNDAR